MTDIRSMANAFEGVKVGLRQTKEGVFITLAIHPAEVPQDVVADWVGTRYMVALVKINDQDEPVAGDKRREAERVRTSAVMLCKDPDFQYWAMRKFRLPDRPPEPTEEFARAVILRECGIDSRAKLLDNERARAMFLQLRDEFVAARRR